MTLRVAFGTSVLAAGLLGDGVDGIGTVTRELLTRLQPRAGLDLRPFEFAEIESGCIDGSTAVGDYRLQARRALLLGRSFSRLKHMVRNKVDLVHATDHQIPRVRGTPLLATLMDAIPLSHPEWVTYRHKRLVNAMWRRSAHWADHIVTISAFSRDEISRHFRIPESRISVMPLGVDERWFHSADAGDERAAMVAAAFDKAGDALAPQFLQRGIDRHGPCAAGEFHVPVAGVAHVLAGREIGGGHRHGRPVSGGIAHEGNAAIIGHVQPFVSISCP